MTPADRDHSTAQAEPHLRVWTMTSLEDLDHVYSIRHEVFVLEQGLTSSVRDDPDDRFSVHVLAAIGDTVVGTGRVTFIGDEGQIAWVAVREKYRGRHVGGAIMEHLLDACREHGCRLVSLNAQTHALSFYERLGFRPVGHRFFMSHIEHLHMVLELS